MSGVWAGLLEGHGQRAAAGVKVEVRGSRFLSEGEVRELLGPAVGENILNLDIDALKARLRSSPWVADATVTRTLPDTLRVEMRERVPLALAELERLYLMDGDGALIDIYGPRTAAFDLPIVRGLGGRSRKRAASARTRGRAPAGPRRAGGRGLGGRGGRTRGTSGWSCAGRARSCGWAPRPIASGCSRSWGCARS